MANEYMLSKHGDKKAWMVFDVLCSAATYGSRMDTQLVQVREGDSEGFTDLGHDQVSANEWLLRGRCGGMAVHTFGHPALVFDDYMGSGHVAQHHAATALASTLFV